MSNELVGFAERVERMCKFLQERLPPGRDKVAIVQLQDEAADIATGVKTFLGTELDGIADVLKGVPD